MCRYVCLKFRYNKSIVCYLLEPSATIPPQPSPPPSSSEYGQDDFPSFTILKYIYVCVYISPQSCVYTVRHTHELRLFCILCTLKSILETYTYVFLRATYIYCVLLWFGCKSVHMSACGATHLALIMSVHGPSVGCCIYYINKANPYTLA